MARIKVEEDARLPRGRKVCFVDSDSEESGKKSFSTKKAQKSKLTAWDEERKGALAEDQKRCPEKNVGKSKTLEEQDRVVNLSSFDLIDVEIGMLGKDLNFAPTPRNGPAFVVVTNMG